MNYFSGSILVCLFSIILFILSKRYIMSRRIFIVYTILVMLTYLTWRTFFSLDTKNLINLILGIIVLVFEWFGFLRSIIFNSLFWSDYSPDKKIKIAKEKKFNKSIDVFIDTYNEPLSILRRTAMACKKINYPDKLIKIYICDDGKRKEVMELAHKRYRYITKVIILTIKQEI